MVTKKTRLMSGLVAVLMLVSMFTAFVVPVSAETTNSAALVEGKDSLPNIADGLKTDATEYQVDSRAGLEKMASIMGTTASTTFSDVTFWQTADIDMGWEPFVGIAGFNSATNSFRGTFDGNGFVIKNLFILGRQHASYKSGESTLAVGIGLFNQATSATFRNVGIASGLVAGRNVVGSIVGYGDGSLKMINCWNAATIVHTSMGDGSAGLIGGLRGSGSPSIINSYNLGMITGYHGNGSQITGWIGGAVALTMKNSYGAGHIVSGWKTTYAATPSAGEALGYHVMLRASAASNKSTGSNNYYVDNGSGRKSYQEANAINAEVLNIDGTAAVTEAALADGTLVAKLNAEMGTDGSVEGSYTVQYIRSDKGYPILEYTKADGSKIARTAEDTANVACNTWAEKSELFAAITAGKNGGLNTTPLGDIHIKDADDFFAYAFITMSGAGYFTNKTYLDADIDMADQEMMPGLKYVIPLFWAQQWGGIFDGGDHKIDNLNIKVIDPKLSSNGNSYLYYEQSGFFNYIAANGVVKNLNLASGTIEMDNQTTGERFLGGITGRQLKGTIYKCQVGLTVKHTTAHADSCVSGFVRTDQSAGVIDSCIFTGTLITNGGHASAFSDWHSAGWIRNSFAAGAPANNNEGYLQGIYRHDNSTNLANTYTTSLLVDNTVTSGNAVAYKDASRVLDSEAYSNGELAWKLNSSWNNGAGLEQVFYTVDGDKTVFGTADNQTRKLTYKNGEETWSVYVNAGTEVTLDHPGLINETFGTPSAGTVESGVLTMPASDVTVEITDYTGLDLTALVTAIEKWDDRNADYYAEVNDAKLADVLLAAKDGYAATLTGAAGAYADQTAIDAAVAALEAFEGKYGTYPNIPRASEYAEYSDAKNFLLKDEHDLAYVKVYHDKFTADVTVELANDITVSSGNIRANNWNGVQASIDGHDNALKNVTVSGLRGWLYEYTGNIKDLTLDSWTGKNLAWQGALLMHVACGANQTIENVKVVNCTATSNTSENGLGALVGYIYKEGTNVTFKNITIEGTTLDNNGRAGNSGFLIGRIRMGTVKVDGLFMTGNTIAKAKLSVAGLAVGESTGDLTLENVIIKDTAYGSGADVHGTLVGGFKKCDESGATHSASLSMENILVMDSGNYPLVNDTYNGDAAGATLNIGDAVFTDADKIASGNESEQANTLTAEEMDAFYASGGVAAKFNTNNDSYIWTMVDGEIAVGDETNAIRTVAAVKDFGSGTESIETYLMVGEKYTVSAIDNYSLKPDSGYAINQEITVANQDYAIPYVLTGVETKPAEDIVADLGRYDMTLFVNNGADMAAVLADAEAALTKAKEALESEDPARINAANDAVQAAWANYQANVTAEDRVLKGAYPYLPGYADIDIYKDLEGYDAKNLAISDRADWIAAVKEGAKTFEGITLHLTDHIDMENDATDLKPLSFGNTFKGTLDGHSYAFTNVKMEFVATAERNDTGLISRLDSPGVVKNLGIANGTMTFDYSSTSGDDIGFAALVGRMNGGGTILRCWNAADVTVTASGGKTNVSVAGIAGRGHQGSVIDGCYNLGTITAPNHASGINDWGQSTNQNGVAGKIFNSFNAGTLVAPGSKALVRYNNFSSAEDALAVQKNSYSLGYPYASDSTTKDAFNKAPYSEMDPAAYASGELAWYLNTGYQEGYGEKTYWTIEGDKTVYGTAANQTVRVVLNFENREDEYVYLNMDDATAELSITYGEAEGNNKPIFKVAEGYKSTIAEGSSTLTYNAEDGDVEVNVTFDGDGIDYINYLKAIEAWGARNSDYFKPNAAGRTLATVVAEARALHKAADATQETVDALAAELVAFGSNYAGYPNLPTISEYEAYSDAPGYLIKTVAELEKAGADSAKYTAAQTLYLADNLDLKDGTSFIGFVDLKASFDGCGNTISNLEITEDVPAFGFFHHFRGASVKNLTLDNVHNRGAYGRAVLVADYYGSGDLTIENVHLLNCSSTATMSAHQGGINAMGTLLSRMNSGGNVTVANCTVVGTKLLSEIPDDNTTDGLGNIGLIIGQVSGNRTFNVTNVLLKDSEMGVNCTFATGIAFGCVEGKAVLNLENVGIINNKRTGYSPNWNCGVVAGMVKDGGKVAMNNMVIYGNDNGTTGNVYDKAFNVYDSSNDANDGVLNQEGWSNVYADLARITQRTDIDDGSASNGNMMNITAEQLPMIAYTINASGVTQKWDVTEGVISFDTDGKGLPVKVEFALKEVDYETLGDISATVYTDADGMPVGLTDETIDALKEKAYWADDVDWDGPYEEDTVVTGIPYPAHDESHETRLVPDADGIHHYTVCNYVAEEVAPCGYKSELAECEFEYVSTAVEGTKPEGAKHKQVCVCGNELAEVACDDGGENFTVTTVPATPEAEGSVTSECKLCGYTHVKTLIKLVGITIDADGAYAGESGEILVKLNNNPGLSGAVVKITYDSDLMTLKDAVLLLPANIPGGENGQQVQEYTTDADADGMVTTTITFAIYGNHDQEDLLKLTFDYSADAVAEDDLSVKAPLKIEVPDVSTFDFESFDVTPYVDGIEIFDIVYGDIDDDKAVTIRDAILMLRHINGDPDLETVEPNLNLVAADIDADSVIEIAEVITVLQYLNHFIDAITRG